MSLKINMKEWVQQIEKALTRIRYGTITLVIHDSRLIRIEVNEKIRLESTPMEQAKESQKDQEEDYSCSPERLPKNVVVGRLK